MTARHDMIINGVKWYILSDRFANHGKTACGVNTVALIIDVVEPGKCFTS
jgi:hypothetical protein